MSRSTSSMCRPVVGSSSTSTSARAVDLDRELEPLALAAGERRERLAEREVAEADVGERAEHRPHRLLGEEARGLLDRHREHVGDVRAAQPVLEHLGGEALALAGLAGAHDAGHEREVGVDDAVALALRAGALGVGAEQRRLDAVGLGERLADRVEQAGVGRRVRPPRAADRRLVEHGHLVVPAREAAVDQRALARSPATPVTTVSTPSGTSTVTSRRLCSVACSTRSAPAGLAHRLLQRCARSRSAGR